MPTTTMKTTTVEHFQTGGAEATLAAVRAEFEARNPGATVAAAAFSYAYPGRPGEGRWVGVEVTYEVVAA